MTPSQLAELTALSQAVQEADAAILLSIKAEETRIRAQLAALDAQHKQAKDLPMIDTLHHRSLGGDMKWQIWVGHRRRELQMQLARCLARQGMARRKLRQSFGKRAALYHIQTDLETKRNHAKRSAGNETVIGLGVLQKGRP
ncbi:MAG: hypothetical protein AAF641_04155 [Pseudomonadota bacterium]